MAEHLLCPCREAQVGLVPFPAIFDRFRLKLATEKIHEGSHCLNTAPPTRVWRWVRGEADVAV